MKIFREFKEFAVKGNVMDMSVGIVIGAAFTSVINALVKDILSPLLGLITADINFTDLFLTLKPGSGGGPYDTLAQAQTDGAVTLNIGLLLNALFSFVIVAITLFFIVRSVNRLRRPEAVTVDPLKKKECPYCFSNISDKATRCPFCTSRLEHMKH